MSDIPSAAPADPTGAAAPRFVGDKPRSKVVPLDWPIEYDGKTYDSVTVSRLTAAQVAAFYERLRETVKQGDAPARFSMFDVPDVVLDALDDDDAVQINEVVERFLPRGFRAAT